MPTPLFPPDNGYVEIQQGRTGDCYVLASMDCLLNGLPEHRRHIEQLFTTLDDGRVEMKLRHSNELSKYLKTHTFSDKGYAYRQEGNFDVFTIHPDAIARIDNDKKGVTTNCLALKILEHITPYYYVNDWIAEKNLASVQAHTVNERHDLDTSSTEFMSLLLGLKINEKQSHHINDIVRAKQDPNSGPIYISMLYGERDKYGQYHGRHAYKLEAIAANSEKPNDPIFILSNPHNNNLRDKLPLSEIKDRNPRFAQFLEPRPLSPMHRLHIPPTPNLATIPEDNPLEIDEIEVKSIDPDFSATDAKKVVDAAIDAKFISGMGREQAERYVTSSLFNYMIEKDTSYLTSSGGLRTTFLNKPNLDPLLFIKQLNVDSPNVLTQIVDSITIEYQKKKNISSIDKAQRAVYDMLDNFQKNGSIDAITRTANLRTLIQEGVLDVDMFKEAFPISVKNHAAQKAEDANNKRQQQADEIKSIFDPVKNNHIERLKTEIQAIQQTLIMATVRDIEHREKESGFMQQLASANNFDDLQKITQLAKNELTSSKTNIHLKKLMDALLYSPTSKVALTQLKVDVPHNEHMSTLNKTVDKISRRISLDAVRDMHSADLQSKFLDSIGSTQSFAEIKGLTAKVKASPSSTNFHYMARELLTQIEESSNIEELNMKLNDEPTSGMTLR